MRASRALILAMASCKAAQLRGWRRGCSCFYSDNADSTSASSASVRGKSSGAPISPSYSTVPLGKMLISKRLNFGGSGGASIGSRMSSIIKQCDRK
jgi:hypothetical protein